MATIRSKLNRYEGRFQNERRREEQERLQRERYAEAVETQRKTMKNVADMLDDPTASPNVRALRKKFSTTNYEEDEEVCVHVKRRTKQTFQGKRISQKDSKSCHECFAQTGSGLWRCWPRNCL